ncbi:MAG: DUF2190 family protein [Ferruginibacter sp.]|nr:DUF2190 family protein [Ferruginibacter sp.]
MAKNFIAPGDVLAVVATAPIASGSAQLIGDLLGVAEGNAKVGETVSVIVEGVFAIPKKPALVIAQGVKLYWDAVNGQIDTSDNAAANKWAGWAYEGSGANAATVNVRLLG